MPRMLACLAVVFLAAAVDGQEEKEPECRIRFLAVGNSPPFRQEIRDGVRYELPPPPGSIPPRRLRLEREVSDGEMEEFGNVTLKLGSVSNSVTFSASGDRPIRLREEGAADPWVSIPFPGEGSFLVILRRDSRARTWDEVKCSLISDLLPEGSLRFINASERTLAVVLGEERIALRAGRTWDTRLAAGRAAGFQLGMPDGTGGLDRVLNRSIEQGRNEKSLVVISEADRPDARSPLKVTVIREAARKQLPPGGGTD